MNIIDISVNIEKGMPYLPKMGPPIIEDVTSFDKEGWIAHRFTLTSLTGTYLEASAHIYPDGEKLENVAIERCIRPATVFHLPYLESQLEIRQEDLAATGNEIQDGDAVIIATGWDRMWNTPNYYADSPVFSAEAVQWIVDNGASIIAADLGSYDPPGYPNRAVNILLSENRLLLYPLIHLSQITDKRPLLVALPIKIKGVCGAPCRAVVIEDILSF